MQQRIKSKSPILGLLFLMLGLNAYAQDTSYFDADWKPIAREKALFYTTFKKLDSLWLRSDYYLSKQIQMQGTYSTLDPEVKEGAFVWYDSTGKVTHRGNYHKDKKTGQHVWYLSNGGIDLKANFVDGVCQGPSEEYYPNGKLKVKTLYANDLQQGPTVYFNETGKKQSEGMFKAGNRDGVWKYYDDNGKYQGQRTIKLDYTIPQAKFSIKLPNENWFLESDPKKSPDQYTFTRTELKDSTGTAVVPFFIVQYENASYYKQNVTLFSAAKKPSFDNVDFIVGAVFHPGQEHYPVAYPNSLLLRGSYRLNHTDHEIYALYLITKANKGIQVYLDMTASVGEEVGPEFMQALESIKIEE